MGRSSSPAKLWQPARKADAKPESGCAPAQRSRFITSSAVRRAVDMSRRTCSTCVMLATVGFTRILLMRLPKDCSGNVMATDLYKANMTTENRADGVYAIYEFTVLRRPWTVNAERKGNRWQRAADTKEWRTLFHRMTIAQFPITDATLNVYLHQRGRLQDTGACLPAVKAAVDGMVDARLFIDDTGEHLKQIVFHAPMRSKQDKLILRVEGKLNGAGDLILRTDGAGGNQVVADTGCDPAERQAD